MSGLHARFSNIEVSSAKDEKHSNSMLSWKIKGRGADKSKIKMSFQIARLKFSGSCLETTLETFVLTGLSLFGICQVFTRECIGSRKLTKCKWKNLGLR
jgi:hypothetical protein